MILARYQKGKKHKYSPIEPSKDHSYFHFGTTCNEFTVNPDTEEIETQFSPLEGLNWMSSPPAPSHDMAMAPVDYSITNEEAMKSKK